MKWQYVRRAEQRLAAGDKRCVWCDGPHDVSDAVYAENPYCSGCLKDRVRRRLGLPTQDQESSSQERAGPSRDDEFGGLLLTRNRLHVDETGNSGESKVMRPPFTVAVDIDEVVVVRSRSRDQINMKIAKEDRFGRPTEYATLHGTKESHNSRDLRIDTFKGNGPKLVRMLGWPGDIEIVSMEGKHAFVRAWDDEEKPRESKTQPSA